jgi:hypothetical protein
MDADRLKHLQSRFGTRIEEWPAPHRAEALAFLNQTSAPLIQALTARQTDEAALSRAVLTRLAEPRRLSRLAFAPRTMMAGYASLLLAFGMAGYGGMDHALSDPVMGMMLGGGAADWVGLP